MLEAQGIERGIDEVREWPTVTIVFLAYNRRDELRDSLQRMLFESEYERELVDVIVVDNASTDGTADMLRAEFPGVELIVRDKNVGVSGWNDGLAQARGDWLLLLDDDCYLPPDGLGRAVRAAEGQRVHLVSFKVVSTHDSEYAFTDKYRTGLFTFWGCAVLMRREVIEALGGYDPEIFVWANELEFLLRFYDRGFKHLHCPEIVAHHMKKPGDGTGLDVRAYRINARHFAYIAGKLFRPRDAAEALAALLARNLRDGLRRHRGAFTAVPDTIRGFAHGLRHREPLRKPELSRFYRRNFESFASPWWLSRPLSELVRALPRELFSGRPVDVGRREQFFDERGRLYTADRAETLQF
jgi:GT2 family glycosyltransferase